MTTSDLDPDALLGPHPVKLSHDEWGLVMALEEIVAEDDRRIVKLAAEVIWLRKHARTLAASLGAVLPLLRTIQEHCGRGDHDEIIARADANLKTYLATAREPGVTGKGEG